MVSSFFAVSERREIVYLFVFKYQHPVDEVK